MPLPVRMLGLSGLVSWQVSTRQSLTYYVSLLESKGTTPLLTVDFIMVKHAV